MELYTSARFISCEKENRIYTAMAVKGGHIVWLGDESSIPPRYGKAKRVDLGGATVTPCLLYTSPRLRLHREHRCRASAARKARS